MRNRRALITVVIAGLCCLALVIYRARGQSITIDEADSYLFFAAYAEPWAWFFPSAGNHVGYSLLVSFFVWAFGLSHFTLRIPALIGAAMYIVSIGYIVWSLTGSRYRALICFLLAAFNPFILDYLIAARGYSLAVGLLACAIAIATRDMQRRLSSNSAAKSVFAVSLCCGLAFVCNFSFAFALASLAISHLSFVALRLSPLTPFTASKLIGAAALGILPAIALSARTLLNWPRTELHFGSKSVPEMIEGITDALFPFVNYELTIMAPARVLQAGYKTSPWLLASLALFCLWIAFKSNPSLHRTLLRLLLAAFTATAALHLAAHYFFGLLLPLDRTSLFFAVFLFVMIASAITVPGLRSAALFAQRAAIIVACWLIVNFAVATRLDYFRLWIFNNDVDTAFHVAMSRYSNRNVTTGCEWRYAGAFNFYSRVYGGALPECQGLLDGAHDKDVYFLYAPDAGPLLKREDLRIIYTGRTSDLIVAVRKSL